MRTYLFVISCINKLFNSIQFNGWIDGWLDGFLYTLLPYECTPCIVRYVLK